MHGEKEEAEAEQAEEKGGEKELTACFSSFLICHSVSSKQTFFTSLCILHSVSKQPRVFVFLKGYELRPQVVHSSPWIFVQFPKLT